MSLRAELIGAYSPLRRGYRRLRPAWLAPLTESGRETARFVDRYGLSVRHGPFTGLRYPPQARGHVNFLASKLLGSYEAELHEAIERIVSSAPTQIVNIGAGDGYYAVGLAMRGGPEVRVVAFELDRGEQKMSADAAALNGVASHIRVAGFCDPALLRETLEPHGCVITDCEGYELELLVPDSIPALQQATVLTELHPMLRPDSEEIIHSRFSATHHIELIRMRPRTPSDYPELAEWRDRGAYVLLSEGWRNEQERQSAVRFWAFMAPR